MTWPALDLPVRPPYPPTEARLVDALPEGEGWVFEPKWDGFRCLAFRDGDAVALQSKAGQPLTRYFPEVAAAVGRIGAPRFVLDGEIVVPVGGRLSFDALLGRIHPSASRVGALAAETPALFFVFDLLVDGDGRSLVDLPQRQRRRRLEALAERHLSEEGDVRLSPSTADRRMAETWFANTTGLGLDGVIAKRVEAPYASGERTAMQKVKRMRTADCVVGGFRYSSRGKVVGSLLLGLHDRDRRLHHVGFTSAMPARERQPLTARLESMIEPPGFTGRAPGGPSRWSTQHSADWKPVRPVLVCEVRYDHWSGDRFRHGTAFVRFRPDKAPEQCTFEQVRPAARRRAAS